MTRHVTHLLLALLALTVLTATHACGNDDLDPAYTDYRIDIVTFLGTTPDGQVTCEMERRGQLPMVTITSQGLTLPKALTTGERVLLRYAPPADTAARHWAVNAYGLTRIISDSLRYTVQPLAHYLQNNAPVKLRSLWRTGNYLNLHCQLEYTGKSRHFYLLLDSATARADTLDCYLVHNVFGDTTYYWRECYASFYVGAVWQRENCRALRVHISQQHTLCFDRRD